MRSFRSDRVFQRYSTPQFARYLAPDFWRSLTAQAARKPALLHALKALAHAHSACEDIQWNAKWSRFGVAPSIKDALEHYIKAIEDIEAELDLAGSSLADSIFICSFIFGCIEILLDNARFGIKHLDAGVKVYNSLIQHGSTLPASVHFQATLGDLLIQFPRDLGKGNLFTLRHLDAHFVAIHSGFLAKSICGNWNLGDENCGEGLAHLSQLKPNVNLGLERYLVGKTIGATVRD